VPSTFLVSICGRDGCAAGAPGWALGAVGCAGACDQPGLAIVARTIAAMDADNIRAMFFPPYDGARFFARAVQFAPPDLRLSLG
jgi:hypothetical protein